MNLYTFVRNTPMLAVDWLGLTFYINNYPDLGRFIVEVSAGSSLANPNQTMGNNRYITIDWTLTPAKICDCDQIDFSQKMKTLNLEGAETDFSLWGYSMTTGEWYPDPPGGGYYLATGGEGDNNEVGFSAWMGDLPCLPGQPQWTFFFSSTPSGETVERKGKTTWTTTAVCVAGVDQGVEYATVTWTLDYPSLSSGVKPEISGVSFSTP